jgi:hypothetical protein
MIKVHVVGFVHEAAIGIEVDEKIAIEGVNEDVVATIDGVPRDNGSFRREPVDRS